ncbi:hypothetical protein [Croceicoccus ponticola]|nr:hypothetical protein [Croceicoccus ponticola]
MSARPDIPVGELVQPAGLPGRYWVLPLEDTGSGPGLIEFRTGEDGGMIGDDAENSGGKTFRLVRTSVPGVYVKITDYDDDTVLYGLLEHRDLGTWQDYGIEAVAQDASTGPNLAWMQDIADRYELTIDARDSDKTHIKGKLDGLAIPSLFADPAFLATLHVAPSRLFLPNPPPPEEREDLFPSGGPSLHLQLDQPSLPGAEWISPPGLEGEHAQGQSNTHFYRSYGMRFVRLADGRFEVRADDLQNSSGNPQVLGVLPIEGLENEYLAVSFDHWKYDDKERDYLTLSILGRTETGWSVSNILARGTDTLAGRQDLLSQPMAEAAQRQGASLDGFKLRGGLSAQALLALLRDGQFTTGLEVDRQRAEHFGASVSRQTESTTAP